MVAICAAHNCAKNNMTHKKGYVLHGMRTLNFVAIIILTYRNYMVLFHSDCVELQKSIVVFVRVYNYIVLGQLRVIPKKEVSYVPKIFSDTTKIWISKKI